VIGVIDLRGGRAVHARAGVRERYAAVQSAAGATIAGDPVALGRAYVDRLGLTEMYVADLDAILGQPPQDAMVAALTALGAGVWIDAGVASVNRARHVLELGAARVVVGLETLPSYGRLAEICEAVGGERVAFSLDLRDGVPVLATGIQPVDPPERVAARAAGTGAGAVIVLDLARVGMAEGVDLTVVAGVRQATPGLTLLAGGGIRGLEDVARLGDAGCDGVLVATALQDGRLSAVDGAHAQRYRARPQAGDLRNR